VGVEDVLGQFYQNVAQVLHDFYCLEFEKIINILKSVFYNILIVVLSGGIMKILVSLFILVFRN
jgi:hypothetical protein